MNREGFSISQKKVQRLMNKADIRSITRKKFRPQGSKDRVMERPNLLQQDFKTTSISKPYLICFVNPFGRSLSFSFCFSFI
ncbi:IS3 family transposase [Brevibacillus laterosporus]|uniref:IS3 family transposase n=1 Tax=Brevibacillus laterosporus TaxID=1465 RepID=UPI003D24042A